jgi:hypothetical protein
MYKERFSAIEPIQGMKGTIILWASLKTKYLNRRERKEGAESRRGLKKFISLGSLRVFSP